MKKIRIIRIVCIILCCVILYRYSIGHSENISANSSWRNNATKIEVVEEDTYFKIIDMGQYHYYYSIYNTDGKLVKNGRTYPREPYINYIDEHTIEIMFGAGTFAFSCIYYDIINDRFSSSYICPIEAGYDKIAYIVYEDMRYKLVVKDMYEETGYYKEFFIDLSLVSEPVTHAEFLDADTLYIAYISGESYEEKSIILDLDVNAGSK